jgi:hypothetical protein
MVRDGLVRLVLPWMVRDGLVRLVISSSAWCGW